MIKIQPGDLGINESRQEPVVAVTARCAWALALVIAGTVGGVAAAAETLTPAAIWAADVSAGTSKKIIEIPPHSTYMEIGSWGDSAALATRPVLKFWTAHGDSTNPGNWSRAYTVLGTDTLTLDGTILDTTGAAGASRYTVEEGTYQKHMVDIRGAKYVILDLGTAGIGGNWSLYVRFF